MLPAALVVWLLVIGCGNAVTQPTSQIIYVTPAPSDVRPTATIASPAPTATPLATPEPTPEPARSPGTEPGVITFGVELDQTTQEVASPTGRFKRERAPICWSAYLDEPSSTSSVTLLVYRGSHVINKFDVDVTDPDLVAGCADLAGQVNNLAGTYDIRFTSQGKTLARGEFTLVD